MLAGPLLAAATECGTQETPREGLSRTMLHFSLAMLDRSDQTTPA